MMLDYIFIVNGCLFCLRLPCGGHAGHAVSGTIGIAIPGSRIPVFRDPARFCNTKIPDLRQPNILDFSVLA